MIWKAHNVSAVVAAHLPVYWTVVSGCGSWAIRMINHH